MPNFKLSFQRYSEDQDGDMSNVGHVRVIVVEDIAMACKIAQAMIGEEINSGEWLCAPYLVEKTENQPRIDSWNTDEAWKRVLEILELIESEVDFIYHKGPKVVESIPDARVGQRANVVKNVTQKVGFKMRR